MKVNQAEVKEATKNLKKLLRKGATVYTVLRHVSQSGMSRRIDLYVIKKNQPYFLSGYAAKVLGWKHNWKDGGIVVGGCGMDMGFHLVYTLSSLLYKSGYALNQRWM